MKTWAVWRDNAAVWREIFGVCWRRSRVLFLTVCICMALDTFAIAGIGLALRAVVTGTTESRGTLIVVGAVGAAFGYAADVTFSELTFSMRINLCELVARLFLVLGLLGSISPVLLVILVAGVVPLYFEQRSRTVIQAADEARSQDKRLQRRLFEILTGGATGKEVRVAGTSAHLVRLQREAAERSERIWLRANLKAGFLGALGWSIFVAAFVAGLAVVVDDAAHNPAHLGDIVLTITVGTQLRSLVQNAVRASTNTGGSGRILEPYRWLRAYQAEHASAATNPAPEGLRDGITFEEVTFTYANSEHAALADLSVHLPAGSIVAIVGEYGSGKTTIVKLLEKMYRPTSGRILIDGVDLATIDTRAWRSSTAAAFQDFGRYQSTFAQAVTLGDLDHPERLADAVAHADAQSLVDRLPDGLDTQLGRAFDGVDLSEGQWQKLALARASMRQAPLLFVLDEPTASLDAPSEHAIFERYMERARAIAPGGITVIVSHRFSTVAGADLILVLDKGRLADAGTHDELLAGSPTYAALYSLQQTAYAGP